MKLSAKARYALRLMVEIARDQGGKAVSLGKVSEKSKISRRYLDQVAGGLKQAALLNSTSGRGGGYRLTRPAGEIRLGQIVEAAIGPINIVDCVQHPDLCIKADMCECRSVYALMNRRITEALNEYSLAELADREQLRQLCQVGGLMDVDGFSCPTT